MSDSIEMTGGCQCGRVRYRVTVADDDAYLCHCTMCRRATGGAFAAFRAVAPGGVVWETVEPDRYRSSVIAERGFCARRGTPLTFSYLEGEGGMDLTIGSFDEPARFRAVRNVCAESRLAGWGDADRLPDEVTADNLALVERWQAAGGAPR